MIKLPTPDKLAGEVWGGLAAMLVALPSAIAFGVTIYAAVGTQYGAYGALAGILGATALGLIAPILGGTNRLITAPCAPAAAVLSAFAIEQVAQGVPVEAVLILLVLMGLLAGLFQIGFGLLKLGLLIKYMPYPVVSGYLSGVGLYIIAAQTPKLLGAPKGTHFWESLSMPASWQWEAITVGVVTAAVMVFAPRLIKAIPAAILGLGAGVAAYFGLGLLNGSLMVLDHNPLIIGPLSVGGDVGFFETTAQRWLSLGAVSLLDIAALAAAALTLAVLLSIDTLKTCVVLDALTHSRHDSNRELIGQGCGNIASSLIGGVPGAGTMGATLVNISSGGTTRLSGWLEGLFSLAAFLLLGAIIAWVPIASLAAILIIIGFRMIDRHSLHFLKSRSTILDFIVIVAVVTVALTVSLIAASATGIILAILLYVREQITSRVVHRQSNAAHTHSKQIRVKEEMAILEAEGGKCAIYELQGSLFFGTADQLYSALEKDLGLKEYIILDFRRVQSIDITAAHSLEIIRDILKERNAQLIFSHLPKKLPTGQDMQQYFDQVGLAHDTQTEHIFETLDEALTWVEDDIITRASLESEEESLLRLQEFDLFAGRKEETVCALEEIVQTRSVAAGEKIFARGDTGDELYLIRRGAVKIVLPLPDGTSHHLSSFGQGNFFGEMAFLDGAVRSADALAQTQTDLYILSRHEFDHFTEGHKSTALHLFEGIASVLARRLRFTNAELQAIQE